MKTKRIFVSSVLSAFLAVLATAAFSAAPAGQPAAGNAGSAAKNGPYSQLPLKGKVISATDTHQYTYIEVKQDQKIVWLAAPSIAVKKGDVIRFEDGLVMTNFFSKSLKRTFPSIIFVGKVVISSEKG